MTVGDLKQILANYNNSTEIWRRDSYAKYVQVQDVSTEHILIMENGKIGNPINKERLVID